MIGCKSAAASNGPPARGGYLRRAEFPPRLGLGITRSGAAVFVCAEARGAVDNSVVA
jgi:hypothetical protein